MMRWRRLVFSIFSKGSCVLVPDMILVQSDNGRFF
jgi:hypothetical protein